MSNNNHAGMHTIWKKGYRVPDGKDDGDRYAGMLANTQKPEYIRFIVSIEIIPGHNGYLGNASGGWYITGKRKNAIIFTEEAFKKESVQFFLEGKTYKKIEVLVNNY